LIKALVLAWQDLFGNIPSKGSIGVLWSQYCLETGSGNACWNYNLGNIKKIRNASPEKYCMLPGTWEMVGGVKKQFFPPDPTTWFRAYDTLADGAKDYLIQLSQTHFKRAWPAVVAGSPAEFAHLLKVEDYYTAPESEYVAGVNRYFNEFMKTNDYELAVPPVVPPPLPPVVPPVPNPEPLPVEPELIITDPPPSVITPDTPIPGPAPVPKISGTNWLQTILDIFTGLFKK
jgi:hypothetical protein